MRCLVVVKGCELRVQKTGILFCRSYIVETVVSALLGGAVSFTCLKHSPWKEEDNEA